MKGQIQFRWVLQELGLRTWVSDCIRLRCRAGKPSLWRYLWPCLLTGMATAATEGSWVAPCPRAAPGRALPWLCCVSGAGQSPFLGAVLQDLFRSLASVPVLGPLAPLLAYTLIMFWCVKHGSYFLNLSGKTPISDCWGDSPKLTVVFRWMYAVSKKCANLIWRITLGFFQCVIAKKESVQTVR